MECKGCGANLEPDDDADGRVVCGYCGKVNALEHPPSAAPPRSADNGLTGIMVGIILATGIAVAVVVLALGLAITGSEDADEHSAQAASAPSGDTPAPAPSQGAPPTASPEAVAAGSPLDAPGERRVKPKDTLEVGQRVHVRWGGEWYRAKIKAVRDDGSVDVHFIGWATRYDEDGVPRKRLRLP